MSNFLAYSSAAVSPPAEIEGRAEANKVGEMEGAETPAFDAARFKAALSRAAELARSHLARDLVINSSEDAEVHYHKAMTEIYLVLEGDGHMELDGDRVAIRPMSAVLIRPGCRHRAVGRLRVVVVAIPAFDPVDEWLEEV